MTRAGQLWAALFGTGFAFNLTRWRKADDTTACSSLIRPTIQAVPAGPWLFAAGLAGFWLHVVRPIWKERRR